jgi:hypothetical protein
MFMGIKNFIYTSLLITGVVFAQEATQKWATYRDSIQERISFVEKNKGAGTKWKETASALAQYRADWKTWAKEKSKFGDYYLSLDSSQKKKCMKYEYPDVGVPEDTCTNLFNYDSCLSDLNKAEYAYNHIQELSDCLSGKGTSSSVKKEENKKDNSKQEQENESWSEWFSENEKGISYRFSCSESYYSSNWMLEFRNDNKGTVSFNYCLSLNGDGKCFNSLKYALIYGIDSSLSKSHADRYIYAINEKCNSSMVVSTENVKRK